MACVLAKFGVNSAFCGKAGNDLFGHFCKNTLEATGVSTEYFFFSNRSPTTLSVVDLSRNGERSFTFYRQGTADIGLSIGDIKRINYEEFNYFHFGTVSLSAEPSRSAVLKAVKYARASGAVISCDLNLRPSLWPSVQKMKVEVLKLLNAGSLDIIKLSEEELLFLTNQVSMEEAIDDFEIKYPCGLLLVTCGADGAIASYKRKHYYSPGCVVNAVDTTGAGDCFLGTALYYLIVNSFSISSLTDTSIKQLLSFANAAAALSTTEYGAVPTRLSLDDIRQMQFSHK